MGVREGKAKAGNRRRRRRRTRRSRRAVEEEEEKREEEDEEELMKEKTKWLVRICIILSGVFVWINTRIQQCNTVIQC